MTAACLPGCFVTDSRWDHRCVTRQATIARPPVPGPLGGPRAVAVEVDRDDDGTRVVVLAPVDPATGRYTEDPIVLDPGRLGELLAALVEAGRIAR